MTGVVQLKAISLLVIITFRSCVYVIAESANQKNLKFQYALKLIELAILQVIPAIIACFPD